MTREAGLIFQAGGMPAILSFISDNQDSTHKDILHSAMAVSIFTFKGKILNFVQMLSTFHSLLN